MAVLVANRWRRCRFVVGVIALSVVLTASPSLAQVTGASSASTHPYPKVNGTLRQLLPGDGAASDVTGTLLPDLSSLFSLVQGDRVGISIQTGDSAMTLQALTQLGREPSNVRGTAIEVYASVADFLAIANRPEIWRIDPIVAPQPAVMSQGPTVHNATAWQNSGITGNGVKVGIIDAGFQGISGLMGTEVPRTITARCYTALGLYLPLLATCDLLNDRHGTAVAESLYDMAPGVELYVANPKSKLDFANTVNWMVSQGVKVINTSIVWAWDGPGDGTSPFSDSPLYTVDSAIAGGVTFVASAGNAGVATWSGPWRDTDGDHVHEFSTTGASELNRVSLLGGITTSLQLRWQDSWTAAATDLDVYLVDAGGATVARSSAQQAGRTGNTPWEFLSVVPPSTGTYAVKVVHAGGPVPAWLQVQAFSFEELQYRTAGSIGTPGESRNPGLLAVGAAPWHTPTTIEAFSSTGPTPDGRVKPDIVGADQGSTVTYGPFGGTSQAAPHIAGLAALVKSAFPAFTPQQVASYLTANAASRGSGRPNTTWGWGFAQLPAVCGVTVNPTTQTFGQTGGSTVLSITAGRTCAWSASSQAPWLTFATSTSGAGSTSMTINVAGNTGTPRTGTLLIGTTSVTMTQQGPLAPTTAPRNLTASTSGHRVTLGWFPPDTPATGYIVEIGTGPALSDLMASPIGPTTSYSFEASDGVFYVRVRAQLSGATSGPSNEVSFHLGVAPAVGSSPAPPPPPPPPQAQGLSAPLNFAASALGDAVTLSWSAPANAIGLLGYLVEAGTAPGLANLAAVPTQGTTLFAPGIGAGTYYVRVRAGTAAALGPATSDVAVVVHGPQPPGVPTAFESLVQGSTVTLRWRAATTGGASTGHVLIVGSRPGAGDIGVFSLDANTSLSVPGVATGIYYVRILAANAAGVSAPSNNVTVVVGQ